MDRLVLIRRGHNLDNFLLPNGTGDWGKFLGNLTAYYVKIILQIEADNNTTPP